MIRVLPFVALLLALAGCGGDGEGTQTDETRSTPPTTTSSQTTPVTSTAVETAASKPALHVRAFRMPSDNVGCRVFRRTLRCDILSGLRPQPAGACELDWAGFYLSPHGSAEPVCAGDTVFGRSAPVLAYGRTWSRRGVECRSRKVGIRCRNGDGHGFTLARERSTTF